MITPKFQLSQDDNSVTIFIKAPHSNLKDLEVDLDQSTFLFACKPYFLRVNFPGRLVEDHKSKSSFSSENDGEFSFTYSKAHPGENFKDIDLITKLLISEDNNKIINSCSNANLIEVIHNNDYSDDSDDDNDIVVENDSDDDQYDDYDYNSDKINLEFGYGFALRHTEDFEAIRAEYNEIFEINPSAVGLADRKKLRFDLEREKFNPEHYLADYFDIEPIRELIAYTNPFDNQSKENLEFNIEELDLLKDIPNIEWKLNDQQFIYCINGIFDIFYAYCYNERINNYEDNIEAGWNISKLAATICWFDVYDSPQEAVRSAFRRSLILPLYRNFQLSQVVLEDLKKLIKCELVYLVKVLLHIRKIFCSGGQFISYNLFIKDLIRFLMNLDPTIWKNAVQEINVLQINKCDVGLNLKLIETEYVPEELLSELNISDSETDDDTTDSDDDDDDDQTSSSSASSNDSSDESESESEDDDDDDE